MGTDTAQGLSTAFSSLKTDLSSLLVSGLIFVGAIVLAHWLRRLTVHGMKLRDASPQAIMLVTRLEYWSVVVIGLLTALTHLGVDIAALLMGLGIFGFALAFAMQDVSKNFIAGLLLMVQQPFRVGEVIQVVGFTGKVVTIDLRATEMETLDGQVVLIPSADIYISPIVNITRSTSRRVDLLLGVSYNNDLDVVKQAALQGVSGINGLRQQPAPAASFHTFTQNAIQLTVSFWIDTSLTDPGTAKDTGLKAVNVAFQQAGVQFPQPVPMVSA